MADKDEEGKRVQVLHECSDHRVVGDEEGNVKVVHALQEGQALPPGMDLVTFDKVPNEPHQYDMRTIYKAKGPSKVSSPKYRAGWDAVFKPDKNSSKKKQSVKKEDLN